MKEYVKVAKKSELSSRRAKRITVEDVDVALFVVNGDVYAVQNSCPHQHFSQIFEGTLNGFEITCPMHGWTFDLRTGNAKTGSGYLKRFDVKVVGEHVMIHLPENESGWS